MVQEEPAGAIYFAKDGNILYRSTTNDPLMPNQVLWRDGWQNHTGSLHLGRADDYDPFTQVARITLEEAQEIARERNLPIEGW